jgi:WD40 repeat protein
VVAAATVAALLSPPGRSFIHDLRKTVGVEHAKTELFSLPARGRLLVRTPDGVWVVHADGSKRLLPGYRDASWSPHGLYIVATKRNELVTLEDKGRVHWKLARPYVSSPRWGGTRTDTRIAYIDKERVHALRVVGGDGRGDHWLAKDFIGVPPAWKPGPAHVLAVAHVDKRIRLWAADTRALVGVSRRLRNFPLELAWSSDGSRLFALTRWELYVLDGKARVLAVRRFPDRAFASALAVRGDAVALILHRHGRSEVDVVNRRFVRIFSGAGRFTGLEWSPDGRWLLVAWREASQWLFIRSTNVQTIHAVSAVTRQFDTNVFPLLAGWCCAG